MLIKEPIFWVRSNNYSTDLIHNNMMPQHWPVIAIADMFKPWLWQKGPTDMLMRLLYCRRFPPAMVELFAYINRFLFFMAACYNVQRVVSRQRLRACSAFVIRVYEPSNGVCFLWELRVNEVLLKVHIGQRGLQETYFRPSGFISQTEQAFNYACTFLCFTRIISLREKVAALWWNLLINPSGSDLISFLASCNTLQTTSAVSQPCSNQAYYLL